MENLKITEEKIAQFEQNYDLYATATDKIQVSNGIIAKLTEDKEICNLCENDRDAYELREKLLTRIKNLQTKAIDETLGNDCTVNADSSIDIKDFEKAKEAIVALIDGEVNREISEDITEDVAESVGLPKYAELAVLTKRHILEEKYSILFMGEYQSGKSTTLDALCNGHMIAAIGRGTVTTSVPVSVSYADKETISIVWKTAEELKNVLAHLACYLEDFNVAEFDIEDNAARAALLAKIDMLRKSDECPKASDLEAKYVILSELILQHYSACTSAKENVSDITAQELPAITRFPQKLEARWKGNGASNFDYKEAQFAFIKRVDCGFPAETLKQLHATVTDCPGLFASSYDSELTNNAMTEADAIFYVLPYDKQIGKDICSSLYTIQKSYPDVHRKLFIIDNVNSTKDSEEIIEANRAIVKDLFGDKVRFICVDSLMAYYGSVKETFDKNLLSQHDIQSFIEAAKPKKAVFASSNTPEITSFDQAWSRRTGIYCAIYGISTPAELIESSGLKNLVAEVKDFIQSNKAYSVILSNGLYRLSAELEDIKKSAKLHYVEPHVNGAHELSQLWNNRLERMDEFSVLSAAITKDQFFAKKGTQESAVKRISNELYGKAFSESFWDKAIEGICGIIYDYRYKIFKRAFNEDKLQAFLKPLVENYLLNEIRERLQYHTDILLRGQDTSFNAIFGSKKELLKATLAETWKEAFKDDSAFDAMFTRYVSIPDSVIYRTQYEENGGAGIDFDVHKGRLFTSLMLDITTVTTTIALSIASYICFVLSCAAVGATNIFTLIAEMLGLAGGAAAVFILGKAGVAALLANKFAPEIKKKIKEQDLYSKFENLVQNHVSNIINEYVGSVSVNRDLALNDQSVATSAAAKDPSALAAALEVIQEMNERLQGHKEFIKNYTTSGENA